MEDEEHFDEGVQDLSGTLEDIVMIKATIERYVIACLILGRINREWKGRKRHHKRH